jgi:hypothetical protein
MFVEIALKAARRRYQIVDLGNGETVGPLAQANFIALSQQDCSGDMLIGDSRADLLSRA